ncbi:MAG: hypothetical protein ACOY45_02560 [Pseudomonadota bacterium]
MSGGGDDPFDPRRWTARGGNGGPITGDEFAYLKDLVAQRLGVGKVDPRDGAPQRRREREH